jgi:hypothetical protein
MGGIYEFVAVVTSDDRDRRSSSCEFPPDETLFEYSSLSQFGIWQLYIYNIYKCKITFAPPTNPAHIKTKHTPYPTTFLDNCSYSWLLAWEDGTPFKISCNYSAVKSFPPNNFSDAATTCCYYYFYLLQLPFLFICAIQLITIAMNAN